MNAVRIGDLAQMLQHEREGPERIGELTKWTIREIETEGPGFVSYDRSTPMPVCCRNGRAPMRRRGQLVLESPVTAL